MFGLEHQRTSSNPDQRNRLDLHSSATPQTLSHRTLSPLKKIFFSPPRDKKSSPSLTHPPALISECRDNYLTLVSAYFNISCPAHSPGRAHNRPADDSWVELWCSGFGIPSIELQSKPCSHLNTQPKLPLCHIWTPHVRWCSQESLLQFLRRIPGEQS